MSVKFEHIQVNGDGVLSDSYEYPESLQNKNSFRPFVPADYCLYLSKVKPEGIGAWRKKCQDTKKDYWLNNKDPIFHLDIDFIKMKILVIDTPEQFQKLFDNSVNIKTDASNNRRKVEKETYEKIIELLSYIKSFNVTIQEKLDQTDEILPILNEIKHNCTINYDSNGFIEPPKSGKSFYHFCNVIKELKRQYDILHSQVYMHRFFEYDSVDFNLNYMKLKHQGYNGIYFTGSLINKRYYFCRSGEKFYKDFLGWLEADTLIIWSWCFNQKTIKDFYQKSV